VATWRSPVLLIYGDDDRNVPFAQTEKLVEALRRQKVDFEELIFPDEIHDFLLGRDWARAYAASAEFLGRKRPRGITDQGQGPLRNEADKYLYFQYLARQRWLPKNSCAFAAAHLSLHCFWVGFSTHSRYCSFDLSSTWFPSCLHRGSHPVFIVVPNPVFIVVPQSIGILFNSRATCSVAKLHPNR
jgi:hypothetical protein